MKNADRREFEDRVMTGATDYARKMEEANIAERNDENALSTDERYDEGLCLLNNLEDIAFELNKNPADAENRRRDRTILAAADAYRDAVDAKLANPGSIDARRAYFRAETELLNTALLYDAPNTELPDPNMSIEDARLQDVMTPDRQFQSVSGRCKKCSKELKLGTREWSEHKCEEVAPAGS